MNNKYSIYIQEDTDNVVLRQVPTLKKPHSNDYGMKEMHRFAYLDACATYNEHIRTLKVYAVSKEYSQILLELYEHGVTYVIENVDFKVVTTKVDGTDDTVTIAVNIKLKKDYSNKAPINLFVKEIKKDGNPTGLCFIEVQAATFVYRIQNLATSWLLTENGGFQPIPLPHGEWQYIGSVTCEGFDFDCTEYVLPISSKLLQISREAANDVFYSLLKENGMDSVLNEHETKLLILKKIQ